MRGTAVWVLIAVSAWSADWRTSKADGNRKYNAGDYAGALQDLTAALSAVPPESLDAAGLQIDLTRVFNLKGDFVRAKALGEQALAIYQRAYGAEHRDIASALTAIG